MESEKKFNEEIGFDRKFCYMLNDGENNKRQQTNEDMADTKSTTISMSRSEHSVHWKEKQGRERVAEIAPKKPDFHFKCCIYFNSRQQIET